MMFKRRGPRAVISPLPPSRPSINELLYAALAQQRLGELVDEMEQEAGAPSPEVYERVLAQWFAED